MKKEKKILKHLKEHWLSELLIVGALYSLLTLIKKLI